MVEYLYIKSRLQHLEMKAKFKNKGRIDLVGQSDFYRVYVNRIVNTNSEDVIGNYSIVCEKYSMYDGYLLIEGSIFGDEKDKPFETLQEVIDFIKRDAVDHWDEVSEEKRINRLISSEVSHGEKYKEKWANEKRIAWTKLYECIQDFLAKHGEPIHRRNWNN